MKKVLAAAAAFGLIGLVPAHAHDAAGIKCVTTLEDVTTEDGGDFWTAWVKVRMRNKTQSKTFKNPEILLSFRDKHGNELDFFAWQPGKLRPGRQHHSYHGYDFVSRPKTVKMVGCHRYPTD